MLDKNDIYLYGLNGFVSTRLNTNNEPGHFEQIAGFKEVNTKLINFNRVKLV